MSIDQFEELAKSSEKFNTEGRDPGDFMQELHQMRPYEDILQLDLRPTEIFPQDFEKQDAQISHHNR